MNNERLKKQLDFIIEVDKMKHIFRQNFLADGSRNENDAEHSFHLALMAALLAEHASEPGLDICRVMKMVLIHDIVEIDAGDTYCYDDKAGEDKSDREQKAADRLFYLLPSDQAKEMRRLWEEFEERKTLESRFAAALDRIQPLLLNYLSGGKSWRSHGITSQKVLERNRYVDDGSHTLWNFAKEIIEDAISKNYLCDNFINPKENPASFTYREIDGVKLDVKVYYPSDWKPADKRPAIIFFFGGGWLNRNVNQFKPHSEHFSSRGMVAVTVEYRVRSIHKVSPFECVDDARDAIAWISQNANLLGIDPEKIIAGGGSAGAHLAASISILEDSSANCQSVYSIPKALVLYNPVLDTTETGYGYKVLGDRCLELSCAHHVKPGLPPTLVLHGTADTTVPFENSERFCREMQSNGNRCTLIAFEGRKHGFFNPTGRGNPQDFQEALKYSDDFLVSLGYLEAQA